MTNVTPPPVVRKVIEQRRQLLEAGHPLDGMVAVLQPAEYVELERWWKACSDEPKVTFLFGMHIQTRPI